MQQGVYHKAWMEMKIDDGTYGNESKVDNMPSMLGSYLPVPDLDPGHVLGDNHVAAHVVGDSHGVAQAAHIPVAHSLVARSLVARLVQFAR